MTLAFVHQEIDAEGNKTESRYDGAGRLVRTLGAPVTDASSGEVWRPEAVVNYVAAQRPVHVGLRRSGYGVAQRGVHNGELKADRWPMDWRFVGV